jgi:hypothetical protein
MRYTLFFITVFWHDRERYLLRTSVLCKKTGMTLKVIKINWVEIAPLQRRIGYYDRNSHCCRSLSFSKQDCISTCLTSLSTHLISSCRIHTLFLYLFMKVLQSSEAERVTDLWPRNAHQPWNFFWGQHAMRHYRSPIISLTKVLVHQKKNKK